MKNFIKQILIFATTFLAIMILAEIYIRTTHTYNPSKSEFYEDIGRGNRKNYDYVYFNEGFGIGRFNNYRYIGEPNPLEKPENTVRFALLGDSFVESFQVFERHYFGNIAEHYLNNIEPDINFEFLNFGRSGFDIADIFVYQNTFANNFNPDFYLLIISNDDLVPKFSDPLLPKLQLKNDSLTISFNFKSSIVSSFENSKFFIQNFNIVQMMNSSRKKASKKPLLPIFFDKIYYWIAPSQTNKITSKITNRPLDPITQKVIENLDPDKTIIINRDFDKLSEEFTNICTENKIPIIDLSDLLNRYKAEGNDLNKWKATNILGHWNHNGHEIIGNYLAQKIIELKKLK